jgi:predicted transcriptional regulator
MIAQFFLFPPEILLGAKLLAAMGICRVFGTNVLDQDLRARIYEYICRNPGIHLRGLAYEMDLKMGTLRYHLAMLQSTHKIAVAGDTSSTRYYENSGTYSADEQLIHKHLRNETTKKILRCLLEYPRATRGDLAAAAGISGPSVSWHMKRLEKDGIVISRREGRVTSYAIPAPVAGCITRLVRIPVAAPVADCPGVTGHA